MLAILKLHFGRGDIAYVREKNYTFETLRLEYGHDCLNDCMVMAAQSGVSQDSQKRIDDDGLEIVPRVC